MATDVQEPITSAADTPPHNVAIKSIKLTNLLSFGPDTEALELRPLNILIGANGSGKSNLIDAISLLQAAPTDLAAPFLHTGTTVRDWLWRKEPVIASIVAELDISTFTPISAFYTLSFTEEQGLLEVVKEELDITAPQKLNGKLHSFTHEGETVQFGPAVSGNRVEAYSDSSYLKGSTLARFKGPRFGAELDNLSDLLSSFRFYRAWSFGSEAKARQLNQVNTPADFLSEDGGNLAAVMNKMLRNKQTYERMIKYLRDFYTYADDVSVNTIGGYLELSFMERGYTIAANRMSDGTLHWLSLLAILLHPTPPPLICLEEPEVGLHPDIIAILPELLRDASHRTQLIITTHSRDLVDSFTNTPDSVIICEKEAGATKLYRLPNRDQMNEWLDRFSLGELWSMNILGGNRY